MNFEQWRHYLRGLAFAAFNKPVRAIEEYRLTLKHNPDFVQAAVRMGCLHAARSEYDEAEDSFLLSLRLKPSADVYFNLGFIRAKAGRNEKAVEAFREAVRLNPTLDRAWYGMGLALGALGQHQEAALALEEAGRLQPMNGHAWYALGMAYHHACQPEKVKEVALHMVRFDPAMTRQLIKEAERADLAYLVKDLQL
jgi:tetratricopeptide (TPR) repeat protein